jgi:hypothetical protein
MNARHFPSDSCVFLIVFVRFYLPSVLAALRRLEVKEER